MRKITGTVLLLLLTLGLSAQTEFTFTPEELGLNISASNDSIIVHARRPIKTSDYVVEVATPAYEVDFVQGPGGQKSFLKHTTKLPGIPVPYADVTVRFYTYGRDQLVVTKRIRL